MNNDITPVIMDLLEIFSVYSEDKEVIDSFDFFRLAHEIAEYFDKEDNASENEIDLN